MNPGRALVCALLPQHDRDAGSRRILDLILFLREAGWAVMFVSHHPTYPQRYARELQQMGIPVYPGPREWMEPLIGTGIIDLAIFGLWHIAEPHMSLIRQRSPATRIIVDSVDLHFLRNARRTFSETRDGESPRFLDADYGSEMTRELNVYAAADAVMAVSQKEADLMNDLLASAKLARVLPLCEELPQTNTPFAERKGMVFIGYLKHEPNPDAVEYLCQEILPQVDPRLLDSHPVYIVGDGVDDTVRGYVRDLPQVHLVGWVPSVWPYLDRARVSLVPLRYGAGTKGKLVQALMAGTPSVCTSVGAEGLNVRHGEHVLLADEPEAFARGVERLLWDGVLWHRLARRGRQHILAVSGRARARTDFLAIVSQVMGRQPKRQSLGEVSPNASRDGPGEEYQALVRRVQEFVRREVPQHATVLVVNKGDEDLLRLGGRHAWHFPCTEDHRYAGYYPPDSAAAIAHLQTLRARGAQYLVFPRSAFWWLDYYGELRRHLETECQLIAQDDDTALIYALTRGNIEPPVPTTARQPHTGDSAPADGHLRPTLGVPGAFPLQAERQDGGAARPAMSEDGHHGVRLLAFYLPQFHPIPENDAWWGKGFTDWSNVTRAKPLFPGHYQPHLPTDLGFYDLRLPEVRKAQADLAQNYGIYGFCYYHYWFGGKRLLQRPFDEVLSSGEPQFPFCLCWANEPWSRRWDGRPHDVLQPQTYSEQDDLEHIRWLIGALRDPRAIRVNGKPLLLIYQARDLPDPARTTEIWRREVRASGLEGIYLMTVETGWDAGRDATAVGFDAKVLFQPQFSILRTVPTSPVNAPRGMQVYEYQEAWPILSNPEPVSYRRYETVCVGWDNSPRRGANSVVLNNVTPDQYQRWLTQAIQRAQQRNEPDERLVFLNAWNEWAEGAHLEPDLAHERAYLEATKRALVASGSVAVRAAV